MASKKELEKRIIQLEAQVRRLENMHARVLPVNSWQSTNPFTRSPLSSYEYSYDGKEASYCGRNLTAEEVKTRWEHPQIKDRGAWTKNVIDVTHEELARYVLDGTPIRRKQEGKVVYVSTLSPGEKTKSVKTDIGNISITKGID